MVKLVDRNAIIDRAEEIDIEKDFKFASKIISDLGSYMVKHNVGALAAPQIGYPYRIFCIMYKTKKKTDIKAYINPVITSTSGLILIRQKCENLPGKEFIHPRYTRIGLSFLDVDKESKGFDFVGKTAFAMEQMMDILDGIVLDEMGLEIDHMFDEASESEKNQLLAAYMSQLQAFRKELNKDIDSTPELKQLKDAVDYMQAVKDGRVQVEEVE